MDVPDHVIVKESDPAGYYDPEYTYTIECLTEGGCGGVQECSGVHLAKDPAYYGDEIRMHGVWHEYLGDYGWSIPFHGCSVITADWAPPERICSEGTPPGRYPVLAVWDDYDVTLEEKDND